MQPVGACTNMHQRHWPDLEGTELRYRDRTWTLTGEVEILRDGALIGARATHPGGGRRGAAQLFFAVADPPRSINPGDLEEHDHELVREDGETYIVVSSTRRRYRYRLQRLEWE